MARYLGPILKRAESLGVQTQVLGVNKESRRRKKQMRQRKVSEYGLQLKEKQKAKFVYGLQEKQFRNLFARANKMKGQAGENLLKLLELRMDNIVYRLGFASTRKEARQMCVHGHFTVNGKKHNIPSTALAVGDVIEVKERSRSHAKIKENIESRPVGIVSWLNVDYDKMKGTVLEEPKREELDLPIEEHLIVELYSK
ncbi:MAG: 30S ribosomal protein S4 [Tissierellia bacterium]|nr:30S ribosomal protein S4 [Tissierellia bacterium]